MVKKLCLVKQEKNSYMLTAKLPTSSVPMHIVNAGSVSSSCGSDSGRCVHIENAITTIGTRPQIPRSLRKLMNGIYYGMKNKHKFENVPRDLSKFDEWIRNV